MLVKQNYLKKKCTYTGNRQLQSIYHSDMLFTVRKIQSANRGSQSQAKISYVQFYLAPSN
ncbi:MAG TPA: hypothetical protein DCS36_12845 [Sphingobacterium sp.]|nr:hypothetical protein [Sphingobacterium sp.]HAK31446.1 hypothetical protein [Sphingobacterium sp.]HAT93243.1 hypothetical protein [Sphingobacterium sp.]HAU54635.1 hypothetical protein [Sphingobacterium sp.]HBI89345.1 hypothetical protein [Sphingobacterium sp.]